MISDTEAPRALAPGMFVSRASKVAEFYGFRPAREYGRGAQSFGAVLETCSGRV